jgi:quercetin dioxygenase-like cupin family protein
VSGTGDTPLGERFEVGALAQERAASGRLYLEFLRRGSMSVGLYELAAGAADPQQPHTEDEVYLGLEGRATLVVEGEQHPVVPGSVVFVAAGADHRFESIESDLRVLVFFAPPEASRG